MTGQPVSAEAAQGLVESAQPPDWRLWAVLPQLDGTFRAIWSAPKIEILGDLDTILAMLAGYRDQAASR